MSYQLKKSVSIVATTILGMVGFSSVYAESTSPQVVSQGGPLGATSIGDQNIQTGNVQQTSQQPQQGAIDQQQLLLELQKQVQELQGQITNMKKSDGSVGSSSNGAFATYSSKVVKTDDNNTQNTNVNIGGNNQKVDDLISNINDNDSIINLGSNSGGMFADTGGVDVAGAPAITSQGQISYLGSYSGNNSIPIGQLPSNLFASSLLGQRSKFDDYSIFFGGFIEANAQVWFGSDINKAGGGTFSGNGQNIYLTSSKLYFLSNLGHYVTAQFDFDADETGNFGLGNAFVIFGNLDTSPFFVSAGKNQLSVGNYGGGGPSSGGITGAFLEPGSVTNVAVNYKDDVWNANIAVFGANDKQANFSTAVFYIDSFTDWLSGAFNLGYVYNLAGAGNANLAKYKQAGGFNADVNLTYNLGPGFLSTQGGWATTTNSNEYNGKGKGNAIAGAWYISSAYGWNWLGRDTNLNFSYGQSYDAADIPMNITASPINFGGKTKYGIQHQLLFSGQRSYFDDNVLFGPEYVYQKLYNGEHMNTISLDMSVYI